jgi:prepilin-type N-terminal cleavage/methylation domain-containing protein
MDAQQTGGAIGMKSQMRITFENSRRKAGFSMAEVLISLAIIAGSMGSFVSLGIMSLRQLKIGTDYYAASLIARNQIERLRTMDFDAAADATEIAHAVDDFGNVNVDGDFTRQTTIKSLSDDLISIEIEIYFPSPRGKLSAKPFVMATMFSRGLH